MPGVHAVVTGRDAPRPFGVLPISKDEPSMGIDRVRYVGEPVAGVAADDEWIAHEALRRIRVEYLVDRADPLRAPGPRRGRGAGSEGPSGDQVQEQPPQGGDAAVRQRRRRRSKVPRTSRARSSSSPASRTRSRSRSSRSAITTARAACTCTRRRRCRTTCTASLSEVLDLPMNRIRVIRPNVGGGFGGKSDPFPHEMICALLSRKCRRPVRITFDREEVFISHHGRHPSEIDVAVGMNADGDDLGPRDRRAHRRGRVRLVRRRDVVLQRRARAGPVPDPELQVSRPPRLHEQADVGRDARPRRRQHALRVRGPVRRVRAQGRARSARSSASRTRCRRTRRRSTSSASRATASSSASRRCATPQAGTTSGASCRSGTASESRARSTSRARRSRSTARARRSRPSTSRSTWTAASPCTAWRPRSGRGATPCSRSASPRFSASTSRGSA